MKGGEMYKKSRGKLNKAKKDLRKASLRTRKYLIIKPLKVSKPPKDRNFHQMEKDFDAMDRALRKYRKLLNKWLELTRKSQKKS